MDISSGVVQTIQIVRKQKILVVKNQQDIMDVIEQVHDEEGNIKMPEFLGRISRLEVINFDQVIETAKSLIHPDMIQLPSRFSVLFPKKSPRQAKKLPRQREKLP